MKVAVFGANGYIGQHLIHYLVANKEFEVSGFDIQDGFKGTVPLAYSTLDISNRQKWNELDLAFDQVYFFSGLTGTDVSIDCYEAYIRVNEIGLLHFLDRIKNATKKPKIIFPSTRLVYKGVKDQPLSEDAKKEFKTIYASSKYNGELYLEMFRNLHGIDYSVFRICIPYGTLVSNSLSYGTINFFLEKALKKEPIGLFGDGSLKRTFTHVMDVCRQIVEVSFLPESEGQCFNVDGETLSLLQIAEMIGKKYNVPVQFKEWPAKALQLESGDTIFDASKIRKLFPDTLTYSLHEWINL